MAREKQQAAASAAVLESIKALNKAGHDDQDIRDALFAYSLSLMTLHYTKQEIARHLYAMALRFADPNDDPLHRETRN